MNWPDFDEAGNLPVGVYQAPLAEALEHFGMATAQRQIIAQRLSRIYAIAHSTRAVAHFIVFGSFVTAKVVPNDVDIFMLMDDGFDASQLRGEAGIVFDHEAAQNYFGASVFWIRQMAALGGEQAAMEDWQHTREGGRRGIVEIVKGV